MSRNICYNYFIMNLSKRKGVRSGYEKLQLVLMAGKS